MSTLLRRSLNSTQFPKIRITLLALMVIGMAPTGLHASAGWVSSGVAITQIGATAQQGKTLPKLELGKPITRELRGGEKHIYQITLAAGQYMHLVVDQQGINVVAVLSGPDGKLIAESNSPNGAYGPEPMSLIAEKPGSHQLQVRSLEESVPTGRYEVKVSDLRRPTSQDQTRIAAERDLIEGTQLYMRRTADARHGAIRKWEAALSLWRKVGDRYEEALTLNSLGFVYNALGEKQKALEYYTQALPLRRAVGDRAGEAATLNNLGAVYFALGEKQRALGYYAQALPLWRAVRDRAGEAATLKNLPTLEPGKPITAELGGGEKHVYQITVAAGQYMHLVVDQRGIDIVAALYGPDGKLIAQRHSPNGEYGPEPVSVVGEKPGSYQLQVRSLEKSAPTGRYKLMVTELRPPTPEDRSRIAAELHLTWGFLIYESGMADIKREAIRDWEAALSLWRKVGDRYEEALTLNSLGLVYNALGEDQKSLGYFTQALALRRAVGDRAGEAVTLNNLGKVYSDLGEKQKAMECYAQALALRRAVEH